MFGWLDAGLCTLGDEGTQQENPKVDSKANDDITEDDKIDLAGWPPHCEVEVFTHAWAPELHPVLDADQGADGQAVNASALVGAKLAGGGSSIVCTDRH